MKNSVFVGDQTLTAYGDGHKANIDMFSRQPSFAPGIAKGIDWLKAHPAPGLQTAPGRIDGSPHD